MLLLVLLIFNFIALMYHSLGLLVLLIFNEARLTGLGAGSS